MSREGGKNGPGRGKDKLFEETLQVRIKAKNPLIERKPSERNDSVTVAEMPQDPMGPKEEGGEEGSLSIYDKIEQTDRTEEIQRAAQELDGATAREPMQLEETKELVMKERAVTKPTRNQREAKPPAGKRKKKKKVTSDTTKIPPREPERKPTPTAPIPKAVELDEDETLVAFGRPQRAGDLQKEHEEPPKKAEQHHPAPSDPASPEGARSITTGRRDPRAPGWGTEGERSERSRAGELASPITRSDSDEVPTFIPKKEKKEGAPEAVVIKRSIPKKNEPEQQAPEAEAWAGVIPQRPVGAPGTHGAGVAMQRQMVQRIDRELPPANAPALKMLRGELDAEALAALDDALAGGCDRRSLDSSVSPKRSLEHLINEKSYNAMTPKDRARLLAAVADDPRDVATIKAGIAILKTRMLERLRDHERAKLLDTFRGLATENRASLARLCARQLRGRSAVEDRDSRDCSLIQRIAELVDGGAVPEELRKLGVKRERVTSLVLASLANPERLSFEEGASGILGIVEFALADCAPAEYTRLWSELVSRFCSAELAGEGRLDLGRRLSGGEPPDLQATPLRIALEDLAILAHPRGKRVDFMMPGGHGIDADVASRALSMVYGAGFTVAAGYATARRHLERVPPDPHRTPPVFVSLLYERGERLFIFDHLESETVFLRAPHGRSSKRAGAFRTDPRRAVVDPDRGLESIALEDFEEWAGVALVPRT